MDVLGTKTAQAGDSRPARMRDAWSAFWQEPDQSHCLARSADIQQILANHWTSFAGSLAPGARILDLGCGAGAVARALTAARGDIHVVGIDFARIPLAIHQQFDLLSGTAMEALPFVDASFDAAVSQFGYEYGQMPKAAAELARVLAPEARFSFVTHHAASSIVAADRRRLRALNAFYEAHVAFCSGDTTALTEHLAALATVFPDDSLISELRQVLPLRIGRPPRERIAIWAAIEDALAPERCLSAALLSCCVAPDALDDWLAPLLRVAGPPSVSILREPAGTPIAWTIEGVRRPANR